MAASTEDVSAASSPFEKVYSGSLIDGRHEVFVTARNDALPLRCLNFFTTKFAWGFDGAAPEELAIAILHDHFSFRSTLFDERVLRLYRAFAKDVIAKFANDARWSLKEHLVTQWVDRRESLQLAHQGLPARSEL